MGRRSPGLVSLCLVLAVAACGEVEGPAADAVIDTAVDGPEIDGPVVDAPADAPISSVDAAVDAPMCQWIRIQMCDTGGTIAQFCPAGTHVTQLRRCDNSTYVPDAQYQMFRLCNCTAQTCGCNQIGVSWQEVECCNN